MATFIREFAKSGVPRSALATRGFLLYGRWGKRLFDIAGAMAGLVISSPLLIFCALLVRLTSRGPILFRQTRVGYRGRPFTLIKFRTMVQGAESLGPSVVVGCDRRLTPVGNFLRRAKLDELPQFINVLRGEMSFVGPRPRVPSEVDLNDPLERILLSVRPGLTSYASIYHRREADYCARHPNPQAVHRTSLLPQKRTLDREYVRHLTLGLDAKLLLLTLVLVCVPGESFTRGIKIFGQQISPCGRVGQMLLDWAVYIGAVWLAYSFRYENGISDFYRGQMWLYIAFIPLLQVGINSFLGVYDMMWRYVTLDDASNLAAAFAPVTLALYGLRLGLSTGSWIAVLLHIPLSIITLANLLALSASLGLRGLRRILYVLHHHYQPLPEGARRVLILGAGLLGLMTALDIRQYPHMHMVGFLDDDPAKYRRLMAGCRVLGNSADLEALCARQQVTDLVICAKSIDPHRVVELHQRCEALRIKFRMLSSLDSMLRDPGKLPAPASVPLSFVPQQG